MPRTSSSTPDEDAETAVPPPVRPTEQIPIEPSPVHATAAVNRGWTGLDALTSDGVTGSDRGDDRSLETSGNVLRRHRLATEIAVGVLVVALAAGLTAWGVGTAVTASLTSDRGTVAALPSTRPASQAGATAAHRAALRATIEAIDTGGSTASWTILTKKGATLTIEIDPATQFGTRQNPESESAFEVGDHVLVVAARTDGTVTATRVISQD